MSPSRTTRSPSWSRLGARLLQFDLPTANPFFGYEPHDWTVFTDPTCGPLLHGRQGGSTPFGNYDFDLSGPRSLSATRYTKEPSWHRRLRRARTESRTTLRNFLASPSSVEPALAWKAIRVLKGHHSQSSLVEPSERILSQDLEANMSQNHWCSACRQWGRKGAVYCHRCSVELGPYVEPVYRQQWTSDPPWQTTSAASSQWTSWQQHQGHLQRPWSPRRRKSPRNRHDPGDKGKGGGKQSGKAGGKHTSTATAPPVFQGPAAPVPKAIPVPKMETSGGSPILTDGSCDKRLLDALVSLHTAKETELPEHVRGLLTQYTATSSKLEAKQMHSLVKVRTEAKKEIARIVRDRNQYETSWAQYIDQLGKTLQEQLQEREKYLASLAAAQEAWNQKAESASAALKSGSSRARAGSGRRRSGLGDAARSCHHGLGRTGGRTSSKSWQWLAAIATISQCFCNGEAGSLALAQTQIGRGDIAARSGQECQKGLRRDKGGQAEDGIGGAAPSMSPWPSLSGPHGLHEVSALSAGLRHSIVDEDDYVSPHLAQLITTSPF